VCLLSHIDACITRVGQDHTFIGIISVYTVFFAGKFTYGHIRCVYTVLANPIYTVYIRYFWQGNFIHTVIYGVYIRFWPTLCIACAPAATIMPLTR